MNLHEDQARFAEPAGWQGKRIEDSPLIKSFNEVWRMLRPVYEHELASLAFRPVPRIRGTGTFIHKIFPHISLNKSHKWAA